MEFSFAELLVVGVIAFLVLGPEDFVRLSSKLGRMLGRARDQFNNFKILAEEEVMASDRKKKKRDELDGKS
jgi:Sec-independent protein translocase protein TatA